MLRAENQIDRFFEKWAQGFDRAIEMFTNQKPTVTFQHLDRAAKPETSQIQGYLWFKQEIYGDDSFAVWIGAQEEAWSALGTASEGSAGDSKQLFFETLSQANQGTAAVLSEAFTTPFRCRDGAEESAPTLESVEIAEIKIVLKNSELPVLLLAIEANAARILSAPASLAETQAIVKAENTAPANGSMLNRLMDLQLPVSVLLGRAVLPIRDVLKFTSGTLIELDRQITDLVDIVVHGTVVARGEIVSVRGNYGVRIKEVISRQDRIALHEAA